MRPFVLLVLTGCVVRERPQPVLRYDHMEAEAYDCPHAPDRPTDRCAEGRKDSNGGAKRP